MVSKLWKIWSGLFIPDPDPDFLPIPDPKLRIQGSKRHRISDPDPQHCSKGTAESPTTPFFSVWPHKLRFFAKYLPNTDPPPILITTFDSHLYMARTTTAVRMTARTTRMMMRKLRFIPSASTASTYSMLHPSWSQEYEHLKLWPLRRVKTFVSGWPNWYVYENDPILWLGLIITKTISAHNNLPGATLFKSVQC